MALVVPSPLVNGVRYDVSSLDLRVFNQNYTLAMQEISYATSLEGGEVRGARSKVISTTRGVQKDEASLTLLEDEARDLLTRLGDGFGVVFFPVVLQRRERNITRTDQLVGCRIKKVEWSAKQGSADALVGKFTLSTLDTLIDGKSISDQNLTTFG